MSAFSLVQCRPEALKASFTFSGHTHRVFRFKGVDDGLHESKRHLAVSSDDFYTHRCNQERVLLLRWLISKYLPFKSLLFDVWFLSKDSFSNMSMIRRQDGHPMVAGSRRGHGYFRPDHTFPSFYVFLYFVIHFEPSIGFGNDSSNNAETRRALFNRHSSTTHVAIIIENSASSPYTKIIRLCNRFVSFRTFRWLWRQYKWYSRLMMFLFWYGSFVDHARSFG